MKKSGVTKAEMLLTLKQYNIWTHGLLVHTNVGLLDSFHCIACYLHASSIAGHFIPKNTVIIPNLFGAHHDPAVWSDPYSFKPGTALTPR